MYAKILIRHAPTENTDTFDDSIFYHQNWMHIYKVETSITNGAFFQRLVLLRTDEVI